MRRACALAAMLLALAGGAAAPARGESPGQTWLFVSDIHLDPKGSQTQASPLGRDTSPFLFRSAIAAMRAAAPHPEVVEIQGDLLAHRLDPSLAISTDATIASAFATAFPHARFLLTLGNNDSDCGDYEIGFDTPFLAAAARAWAPLVDRDGAAPDFARTFAHDGFARVALPFPNRTALVVDDAYWTPRYADACATKANPSATVAELQRALDAGSPAQRYWLVTHVPPGIDAYSTSLARGFVDVPFLRPSFERDFESIARGGRLAYAIAGHTHKFGFRVAAAGTPQALAILGVPAISPIFGNRPAFLTARADPDGTLRAVVVHAFDGSSWHAIGGFQELGVDAVTPQALEALQRRLRTDASLRATYARLYDAGGQIEITPQNEKLFLCAATHLAAGAYRRCAGQAAFDPLSPRGLVIELAALLVAAAVAAAFVLLLLRRSGRRRPSAGR